MCYIEQWKFLFIANCFKLLFGETSLTMLQLHHLLSVGEAWVTSLRIYCEVISAMQ